MIVIYNEMEELEEEERLPLDTRLRVLIKAIRIIVGTTEGNSVIDTTVALVRRFERNQKVLRELREYVKACEDEKSYPTIQALHEFVSEAYLP